MPRLARLDAPGVIHHVIIRGIERRKIFRDNKDRNDMIDRLADLLPATKTSCYACEGGRWCRKCLTIYVRYETLIKCQD